MTTNILTDFADELQQMLTHRPGGDMEWYFARASAVLDALHAMPAEELQTLLKSSHSRGLGVLRGISSASADLAVERKDTRWLELALRGIQIEDLIDDFRDMAATMQALEKSAIKLNTQLHHHWKPSDLPNKLSLTYRLDPVAAMKAKATPFDR
jgi:hypothetical protein